MAFFACGWGPRSLLRAHGLSLTRDPASPWLYQDARVGVVKNDQRDNGDRQLGHVYAPRVPGRRWRRSVVRSRWRFAVSLAAGIVLVLLGLLEGLGLAQIAVAAGSFSVVLWVFLVTYIS